MQLVLPRQSTLETIIVLFLYCYHLVRTLNFSSMDLFIKKSKSILFLYLKANNDSCPSNLNIECYTTHPSSGRNGFSSGFPSGSALGKSLGKPIPALTWMCSIVHSVTPGRWRCCPAGSGWRRN